MTRRDWTGHYASGFRAGDLVQAWDKSPRNGGHRVATIRLTDDPVHESTAGMFRADYHAEGFAWMNKHIERRAEVVNALAKQLGLPKVWSADFASLFNAWIDAEKWLWVVRFELVEVAS